MSENSQKDDQQLSEEEVRELARSMSVAVLKRLKEIALHGSEAAAVQACAVILDHAWGRHRIVTKHPGAVIILPAKEPVTFDQPAVERGPVPSCRESAGEEGSGPK